jgi:hypothetical protein
VSISTIDAVITPVQQQLLGQTTLRWIEVAFLIQINNLGVAGASVSRSEAQTRQTLPDHA